eukprot:1911385-Amphidinium_carterae.1
MNASLAMLLGSVLCPRIPIDDYRELANDVLRVLLRHRFGLLVHDQNVSQCQLLKSHAGPNDTVTFAVAIDARMCWIDGCHALSCSKHLHTRRHNMLRDHIAAFARPAGLYTQVEQRIDPQIAEGILPEESGVSSEW